MTGYGDAELSDTRIAAMSPAERRDLIQRLQRPLNEVFPPPIARRMRRSRLTKAALEFIWKAGQLMLNGMRQDHSWACPGQHYVNIYDYIRHK